MSPAARSRATPRAAQRWKAGPLVAGALLALVAVAVLVIARRARGINETEAIALLELDERDLSAQISRLEVELAEASSWSRIGPAAERQLGLREAADTQLVTLSRTAPPGPPPARP
jgi:cell division protein FtsL